MMNRTLAVVMVLSMAGVASAGLQIEVSGGKALVTGQLDQNMYLILTAGDGAALSNFHLGAMAPGASYFAAPSEDFREGGVPIPAGFDGEGWYLGIFPGEMYKTGVMLTADMVVTTEQETRSWLEKVSGCWPGAWFIRTWTEVMEIQKGSLSLAFLTLNPVTGDIDQTGSLDYMALESRTSTITYFDQYCIPEPATLALFGLGTVLIRRKHSA